MPYANNKDTDKHAIMDRCSVHILEVDKKATKAGKAVITND